MDTDRLFKGEPVSLENILSAREARVRTRQALLKEGGALISFTVNMPGAVKCCPLSEAVFNMGTDALRAVFSGSILREELRVAPTGPEAFFVIGDGGEAVKRMCVALEQTHMLGCLFDMDVIAENGQSISRTDLGLAPRLCLLCGRPAKACARSRAHSLQALQEKIAELYTDCICAQRADACMSAMEKAILYEVSATPKPGLVDRADAGAHSDMDYCSFLNSCAALMPHFRQMFACGKTIGAQAPGLLFDALRCEGLLAERSMLSATGGANTHKGLIFSFGLIAGATGALSRTLSPAVPFSQMLSLCREMAAFSLSDFQTPASTHGERCYCAYHATGARGEAAAGFPSAVEIGLSELEDRLAGGASLNDASVLTLLRLISCVTDTNMLHRGGKEKAEACRRSAGEALARITPETFDAEMSALSAVFEKEHLSPGGCADLLALTLFFRFALEEGLYAR